MTDRMSSALMRDLAQPVVVPGSRVIRSTELAHCGWTASGDSHGHAQSRSGDRSEYCACDRRDLFLREEISNLVLVRDASKGTRFGTRRVN